MVYDEFLTQLIAKRACRTYFEIGVARGALLSQISAETAIGIDPAFELEVDVTKNKKFLHLNRMTSDQFFAHPGNYSSYEGCIDFAFLDGMHVFEFLLRDFYNTERICHGASLIAIHDCLPLNDAMAEREFSRAVERGEGTPFPWHWTGDVWKIIPILKKYRPDLKIVFVDAQPTGLVFVTNLNPKSDVLRNSYLQIVEEFRSADNDLNAINQLYNSLVMTSTDSVLNEHDHTLYFRI